MNDRTFVQMTNLKKNYFQRNFNSYLRLWYKFNGNRLYISHIKTNDEKTIFTLLGVHSVNSGKKKIYVLFKHL